MKKVLLSLLAAAMLPVTASAQQIAYTYDASGNRISRSLANTRSNAPRKSKDSSIRNDVYIGPNPTQGQLTIRLSVWNESTTCHLLLSNIAGQVLTEQTMSSIETTLDLSSLSNGYYILQVEVNGEKNTYKIIKN